jgi:hypothetical protein
MQVLCFGHETIQHKVCALFTSEFTTYNFSFCDGNQKWTIQKRYSDFRELDHDLARKYPKRMQRVLRLPPKKVFGNNSPALLSYRQQALDAYLKSLLKDKGLLQSDEIRDFLEIPLEAALSDFGSENHNQIVSKRNTASESVDSTEFSQAETSPRALGVMKVKSWQEEAELKWGDLMAGDLIRPSQNQWAELVNGDLLTPRD